MSEQDMSNSRSGATVDLRDYAEALFKEHVRAAEISERERTKAAEALFAESRRASELAERERTKAAGVLREEQRRAQETADQERSKAATVLANTLAALIKEGDDRLREHILDQVSQVSAALASAEKLSAEQLRTVEVTLSRLQDEMILRDAGVRDLLVQANGANDLRVREAFAASEKAIQKADDATEKRFDAVNDLRVQLTEQARDFMPREVAEAQISELRQQIQRNTEQLGKLT